MVIQFGGEKRQGLLGLFQGCKHRAVEGGQSAGRLGSGLLDVGAGHQGVGEAPGDERRDAAGVGADAVGDGRSGEEAADVVAALPTDRRG